MFKDIWIHRTLIWAFVKRDLKGRYVGSTVGFMWTVIQPLAMILVYAIVFSQIMASKLPGTVALGSLGYVVYLCAGILPWMAMQDTFMRSCTIFIEYASLIKKVSFPPVILNAYIVLAGFINLLISFLAFFIVTIVAGAKFGPWIFLLPISLLVFLFFLFTISLWLSTIHIFFRDTQQIVSIVLTVWFWVTPIVYMKHVVPDEFKFVTEINPAHYLITMFRDPLFMNQAYGWTTLVFFLSTIVFFIIGRHIFIKLRKHIPDEI